MTIECPLCKETFPKKRAFLRHASAYHNVKNHYVPPKKENTSRVQKHEKPNNITETQAMKIEAQEDTNGNTIEEREPSADIVAKDHEQHAKESENADWIDSYNYKCSSPNVEGDQEASMDTEGQKSSLSETGQKQGSQLTQHNSISFRESSTKAETAERDEQIAEAIKKQGRTISDHPKWQ